MEGDGNCGYYGIISQVYPDSYKGNVLGSGKEIPSSAIASVYITKYRIFIFSKCSNE
jgi:hypothetical protein